MPLDPILEPLVADYPVVPADIEDYPAFREATALASDAKIPLVMEQGPAMKSVRDCTIPVEGGSIELRIFTPFNDGPLPIHVYLHGGGFVLGSIFSVSTDNTCRDTAAMSGRIVIAVNYRKAPEHKFPVPLNDCYAALLWASSNAGKLNGRADLISVGGASAGGNLAAALTLKARDEHGPAIVAQVLEVPLLDMTFGHESHDLYGTGYPLSHGDIEIARRDYVESPIDYVNPYASPLHEPDLSGLPPALILAAEYDVLSDDGRVYAERLNAAGVPATFSLQRGQVHVSGALTKISPAARAWRAEVINYLRQIAPAQPSPPDGPQERHPED